MSMWTKQDYLFMERALELAAFGSFSVSPNPMVGCVLVKDGLIIGEGYHQQAGTAHAEVNALNKAGLLAQGATAYVTLEPCAHQGRTGPCCVALADAKVAKVVIAMQDPFAQVAGRGIAYLKESGIEVAVGLMSEQASFLNRAFIHRVNHQRPYVILKQAVSMDAKVALANGASKWITGERARADVQVERAKADVILTGVDTILADNPRMNVRLAEMPIESQAVIQALTMGDFRQPIKAIIDSQNRLTGRESIIIDAQTEQDEYGAPTIVFNAQPNTQLPLHMQQQAPLTVEGKIDLSWVMQFMHNMDKKVIWVESGNGLASAFLRANLVDELLWYQAPFFIGPDGIPAIQAQKFTELSDIPKWQIIEQKKLSPDNKIRLIKETE